MKVVITSATEKEIVQIKQLLNPIYTQKSARLQVSFHESGVGILSACFSIAKMIFEQKPDLVIQAGIAGTFDNNNTLGKVVAVKDEMLADTGVEENGSFKDLFDLNLQQENLFPFAGRKLHNIFLNELNYLQLDEVTGITINEITTRTERIEALKAKYHPAIESMEGASLHYCCLQTSTPFIQIRAISNYIGERDKTKWNFKDAFENLTGIIIKYVDHLYSLK
ncbi:MAG: mqnB [Segetibacter sp.]|nr:mqnB [Segetibacter sp.]